VRPQSPVDQPTRPVPPRPAGKPRHRGVTPASATPPPVRPARPQPGAGRPAGSGPVIPGPVTSATVTSATVTSATVTSEPARSRPAESATAESAPAESAPAESATVKAEPVTSEPVTSAAAESATVMSGPSGSTDADRTAAVRATPAGSERPKPGGRAPRTLGSALVATFASTVAPGSGHLLLRRRRTGGVILGGFLLMLLGLAAVAVTMRRDDLLENALSTQTLMIAAVACLAVSLGWMAVIVHTWRLACPRGLDPGRRTFGVAVVAVLCLLVAAPLGFAANLANSQRNLLDTLFVGGGGTAVAEAITKPRLNVLLVGSDAGPDRTGTRTDTMMVASLDTTSGRTTLFGLPRNIGFAQFPPGSAMAAEFPKGFHDASDPASGNFLLNAVYAYGGEHPDLAPAGPTADPGLNLLHQTVSYMLGLQLDYYLDVNMAGFSSLIDAVGGLTVDVGPTPIPIGGISPSGRAVEPDGYIPAGVQILNGEQALAFARSRTDSTDYARMGRQRCLIRTILTQKSPTDLLANFQAIATAATTNVSTNLPQEVLPALVSLAGSPGGLALESVSFDPNLPDPAEEDGNFEPGRPNFPYMREVVEQAVRPPAPPSASAAAAAPADDAPAAPEPGPDAAAPEPGSAAPMSLAATCA